MYIKNFQQLLLQKVWKKGDLEMIKWLYKKKIRGCPIFLDDVILDNGDLDVIKWLYNHCDVKEFRVRDFASRHTALEYVVSNNRLDIIQWIYQTFGDEYIKHFIDGDVRSDDLDMLVFLHEKCKVSLWSAVKPIIEGNNLNSVKYLFRTYGNDIWFNICWCTNLKILDYLCERFPNNVALGFYGNGWVPDYLEQKYPDKRMFSKGLMNDDDYYSN